MDSSRSYLDQTVRLHVLSQAGASPRRRSPGGGGEPAPTGATAAV